MFKKETVRILVFALLIFPLMRPSLYGRSEQEFDAGEMIFEHILDNHEWHILTFREKHICIPLPILLIHEGNLHGFMSSKFRHGHADYRGFRLMTEGKYKGKIVHIAPSGQISDNLPVDLSITKNVFSLIFVSVLLFVIFWYISKVYKRQGSGQAPHGLQNLIEPIILFVRNDIAKIILPPKYIDKYLPYLLTLFFFILFCNLLGLIPFFPGGANVTGNIAVTLTLAVITFLVTNFSGKRAYYREIINYPGAPWWVKFPLPLMPTIEFMGLFTKPVVLMFRLFANMMAGHIMILGFVSLIFIFGNIHFGLGIGSSIFSISFALFISILELIVSFIQAFVFTLLTGLYIGSALQEHH